MGAAVTELLRGVAFPPGVFTPHGVAGLITFGVCAYVLHAALRRRHVEVLAAKVPRSSAAFWIEHGAVLVVIAIAGVILWAVLAP